MVNISHGSCALRTVGLEACHFFLGSYMHNPLLAGALAFAVGGVFAVDAFGLATVIPSGSGVEARFASQSNLFTASNPTVAPWAPPGFGPYPSGAPIPGLPGVVVTTGNNFQVPGGWTDFFNDNAGTTSYTLAQSNIADAFPIVAAQTQDIQVTIPFWRLEQAPLAVGYAFEQLNFTAEYLLTPNTGLTGSTPNFPLTVTGDIKSAGAYAQFEAVIEYQYASVNTAGVVGPFTSLGILTYSTTVTAPGVFTLNLNSAGALAATPAGDGLLQINGFMFIAGDPFEMTIIPEPTAMLLAPLAWLLLARRTRKA